MKVVETVKVKDSIDVGSYLNLVEVTVSSLKKRKIAFIALSSSLRLKRTKK